MYLNCKTNFSFRYGAFKTAELVNEAAAHGVTSLAITNINNTCDLWDFVDFCRNAGINPVAGVEIRNENTFLYLLLAKNSKGILDINRFLSLHLQAGLPFPQRAPAWENVFVVYPMGLYAPQELLDQEMIGVQIAEINKLFGINTQAFPGKFVIRHPVTFKNKELYAAHRLLRAIDKNTIGTKLRPADIAEAHEQFIAPALLLEKFRERPDIIANTLKLLDNCTVDILFKTDKTKKVFSSSRQEDRLLLEKLALEGMHKRYGSNHTQAAERIKKELGIIDEMEFNAYYLITWDIIRYAQRRGFYYVGRGSGANSIVAYCLQITDVDPLELDLYFERFLNLHRKIPPDFDIDFSWRDRDEIFDYIFKRYGKEHVCLLGSYTTFQSKAIRREIGKTLGLPKEEIDQLEAGNLKNTQTGRLIERFGNHIKGFPNHLSIHAGGILISEEPIYQYTVVELPPKGFGASQIDMFLAEKIGLYKLDILSQRGLGHIRDTISLVQQNQQTSIDIREVEKFKKDKEIAARIRKGDTIGCFYIESPGMRQLLTKLECDNYLTLVAASSIIRPGVAQSGMMRQYIYRYHHPKDFTYLHPKMEELLKETYGIMIYQEDVIKVAHHFAGIDMAEADILRRAMNGKYRDHHEFDQIREKFFNNCRERGYAPALTSEVWRQIESFGGFSFSKAHSASFAVESYQSIFLKTYYPVEFMVAVINNFGGFYNRELYFHELKKTGAVVHAPCVNNSDYLASLKGNEVYTGFIHIQGLEEQLAIRLIEERTQNGHYLHLQDLIERLNPSMTQLNILIRIGALRFSGRNKKELLWEANFLQKKNAKHTAGKSLFIEKPVDFRLPALEQHPLDDALDEITLLGFPLCNVFELVDDDPYAYVPAADIPLHLGKEVVMLGYFVVTKPVNTIRGETMHFGTFIDADGDWLDTVHFPDVCRYAPLTGKGFYRLKGRVIEEFGVFTVEVNDCKKVGIKDKTARANKLKTAVNEPKENRPFAADYR